MLLSTKFKKRIMWRVFRATSNVRNFIGYTTLETGRRRVLQRPVIPVAYPLPLYGNPLPPPPDTKKYIFDTALMFTWKVYYFSDHGVFYKTKYMSSTSLTSRYFGVRKQGSFFPNLSLVASSLQRSWPLQSFSTVSMELSALQFVFKTIKKPQTCGPFKRP